MTVFWSCETTENSKYQEKIQYLSEPSIDLIDSFKGIIVNYEYPSIHSAFVHCNHVDKSQGYLLFILSSRVEILIKIDNPTTTLLFMDCDEVL